jgi:hypothetical protein
MNSKKILFVSIKFDIFIILFELISNSKFKLFEYDCLARRKRLYWGNLYPKEN